MVNYVIPYTRHHRRFGSFRQSVTCGAPNLLVDSVGGNGARLIWSDAF